MQPEPHLAIVVPLVHRNGASPAGGEMTPSSSRGNTSWLREVVENSAALIEVMTPEIKHGLRVAREAISLRAGSIAHRQPRDRGAGTAATRA